MRHTRNKSEIITGTVLLLFGIAGTAFAVSGFSGTGFFREHLGSAATIQMFTELLLLFLYLVLSGMLLKKQMMRNLFCLFGISVFLWIHRIFMPVAVCSLYCGFLILSGEVLLVPLRKKEGARSSSGIIRAAHDFLTGCAFYMIFIEFLSYLGLGSLFLIRLLTGILFIVMLLLFFLFDHSRLLPLPYAALPPEHVHVKPEENRTEKVILLSLTAVLILLQAGRLNIALDYDSLHYGLRTPFILNNGHGIYENLGLVNDVYFYPKGFEILAMPLSGVPTFGFVLSFSLLTAVFCLVMIGNAASEISGKRAGIRAAFLASCIPGIMNMAASAKSDIGTLLFQIIFLNDLILYLKDTDGETGNRFFLWGTASLFMTLSMKPTSFVFSAVLFLTALPVCLAERKKKKNPETEKSGHAMIILPALIALFGVTARTFLLTGYPVTSVFSSVWAALGFKGVYPVAAQGLPDAQGGASFGTAALHWLSRIKAFLFQPAGDANRHILIAWGTVLFPVLLLGILIMRIRKRKEKKTERNAAASVVYIVLSVLLVVDAVTIAMLWQIDGNYYMLTYAVTAVAAAVCFNPGSFVSLSPVIAFAVLMTGITNWAGASGFTPVSLYHYGFYDHVSDIRDAWSEKGCRDIWDYLNGRHESRVLAFAGDPECYELPCVVQSYADVEGSGGNVKIVKTLDEFKGYLNFAGTRYLYTEESFLKEHKRAAEIIRYMKEDGSIREILSGKGSVLYEYGRSRKN